MSRVDGCTDDEESARASIETQLAYLRPKGRKAGVIVFMDPIADQTAAARAVYKNEPDPVYQACFALVGGTFFRPGCWLGLFGLIQAPRSYLDVCHL